MAGLLVVLLVELPAVTTLLVVLLVELPAVTTLLVVFLVTALLYLASSFST